jgi:uncharacterized protein (TIGR02594 family)
MSDPKWLAEARKLLGLEEIHGPANAPEILELWSDAGLKITDDEVAWCAGFVGGCLKRGGVTPTRSAAARSYSNWGFDVWNLGDAGIPVGAIVVYKRDPNPAQGHVGFAVGRTAEGHIMTLGGNQGDKVSIRPFKPERLVAVRWPNEGKNDMAILYNHLPLMSSDGKLSDNES